VTIPQGSFGIFYPEDAHAPMGSDGPLHKVVVKVAVDWQ
jgi:biofilm protein TabA